MAYHAIQWPKEGVLTMHNHLKFSVAVIFIVILCAVTLEACGPNSSEPSSAAKPVSTPTSNMITSTNMTPAAAGTGNDTGSAENSDWDNYHSSSLGISFSYPTAWAQPHSGDEGVSLFKQELDCGSCRVLPPGMAIVIIRPDNDRSTSDGLPWKVGTDQYAGVAVQASDRGIEIHYKAEGRPWLLQGTFAEPLAENPNVETFYRIAQSIHHEPVALVSDRQSMQPEQGFQPIVPLSADYLHPQAAITAAYRVASETDYVHPNLICCATSYQHLYHLATAETGYFNSDTTEFYEWLVEHFRSSHSEEYMALYDEHIRAQIAIGISKPDSDIGRKIRQIETGHDSQFPGSGPDVYWTYLIEPYFQVNFVPSRPQRELMTLQFEQMKRDHTYVLDGDLGQYMAHEGFLDWRFPYEP